MAEVNLGSPRIRAAMRVLGVVPREIAKLDPAAPEYEGNQPRFKMHEMKRQNLIDEIKRKAGDSPEVDGKDMMAGGSDREARNRMFMEEVERAKERSIEMMNKIAKKDVQNVVISELETKAVAAKGKKRMEEGQHRLKELKKVRDEELASRKKEAVKKQEKNQEVRNRANQALLEHCEEMREKVAKKQARAAKKLDDIAAAHQASLEHSGDKQAKVTERQENYKNQLVAGKEKMYAEFLDKHERKMQMLADIAASRESHAEELAEKQRKMKETVQTWQLAKQAAVEEKYAEILDRHVAASKVREENLKASIKEFTVRNVKRAQSHASRYEKVLEEFEKDPGMKLCASAAPGSPKFVVDRAEYRKQHVRAPPNMELIRSKTHASIFECANHHRSHESIVAANRLRLRRAHHYGVSQQLEKLSGMRQKVQVMLDCKKDADDKRMEVTAKCAVQKMHLTDKVERIKNSNNPEKMYSLLENLDPDPEAVSRINELLGELGMQKMGGFKEEGEEGK